jgi:glycosyltransferase involved in cell wall biosynthesis
VRAVIAFDADVIGRRRTGDETYATNVLAALDTLNVPFRVLAYVREPAAVPPSIGGGRVVVPVRVNTASHFVRNALHVPARLRADRPALFHGNYLLPAPLPCPGVVSVHDCSFLRRDDLMSPRMRAAFRRFVPWSARRAARVVTFSEFTRRDLLELLPELPPERVVAIPHGVSTTFQPVAGAADLVRACYGIDAPYVLFVGALQPRKNLRRLLEAWRSIKGRHPHSPALLVLAGAPKGRAGEEVDELTRRLDVADSVRRVGYVESHEALGALLSGARVLAFPSLYEGFGLPVVEAMACGTPVVASNTTALPEVTAGAAVLVDPMSPAAIADGLERVLWDDAEHARLRRDGLRRARELTWERAAERLAAVYLDVLGSRVARARPAIAAGAARATRSSAQP